jgi:cell wall-associated NlpC family hydrolase
MMNLTEYLNKPFVEGINDCYSLAREFYQHTYGVTLGNYARPTNWYLVDKFNFFTDNFEQEGFFEPKTTANKVRYGDALLMVIGRSTVANHVAIYVGQNKILHNLTGGISRLDSYSDRWRSRVTTVLRHPASELGSEENAITSFNNTPHHIKLRSQR